MENNKIKLQEPVIKNSLKSLKEINKKDDRKKEKKEHVDSYYDETFLKVYFKKRELKIKNKL